MEQIPDHPGIARCLRTGYPDTPRRHMCDKCGERESVAYGDWCGYLCEDCIEVRFLAKSAEEKADIMGLEVV